MDIDDKIVKLSFEAIDKAGKIALNYEKKKLTLNINQKINLLQKLILISIIT